ncbi:uncharacterized protein prob1 [Xyrauchen texanus]|uniref:uncharacterized protein prob1 n=1 Tax=Xyrauchen texanus TaxID=154827 RepID=UPI00224268E4|nr:uncharacterized protein prob1 [Xyrauchen texanus]
MTKSSPSITKRASQTLKQRDEGESDLEQVDDIKDDSASSYYTALCSLSDYSEALEDRTHVLSTEPSIEGDSLEFLDCASSMEVIPSWSSIKDITLSQEYKTQEDRDKEVRPEGSQCKPDKSSSSERESLLLESESKHLLTCTSKTNADLQSGNTVSTDPILKPDTLKSPRKNSSVNPRDFFGVSGAVFHTNIRTAEEHSSSEPRFTSSTILITPVRNQYSKIRKQEHGGREPKEDHTTQKQRTREGLSALRAECRLDSGRHIKGHIDKKGEGQGMGVICRKEQAELSLRSRNRKASANCISTPTASKQEPRIPPHCYSERIPATGHQHQLQRFADTLRLERQCWLGIWQSRPLSYTQPCHTKGGTTGMGTKLAEASSEVGGLVNLAQNTQNTSACSESSSFECIDVALETTEEINRGLKTVPKRQIQLKRRDTTESHDSENNNESLRVSKTHSRIRDIFQRQHSTPAAFHKESHVADQRLVQAERKQRLQKSFSLDETSSKTKMASSIIKSVLSKKMQHEQNICTVDLSDKDFASIKVNNRTTTDDCLYLSGKDVYNETIKPKQSTFSQSGPLKSKSQIPCSSIHMHSSVNSKTQPKLLSKHSFNPLISGIGKCDVQGSGTEITAPSENEKAEKLIPREEVMQHPNPNPGAKLSCHSAKGRAWNTTGATNVVISTQDFVKTTTKECLTGQIMHKQHNMTQTLTSALENQDQHGGSKESTLSPINIACQISDLEADAVENTIPQFHEGGVGNVPENVREEVKTPGQFTSQDMQSHGKLKTLAPVHVVRDMRSLVKNTYNLSFKGPVESNHGMDGTAPFFPSSLHNQSNSKSEGKGKGYRQDEKPHVWKVNPPLPMDRMRDLASHHSAPRGCSTKAMPPVESNDKSHTVGLTKVRPLSITKANSCAMSNPTETPDNQIGISKVHVLGSDITLKQINRTDLAIQNGEGTEVVTNGELNKTEHKTTISSNNDQQTGALHGLQLELQYHSPTVSSEQQEREKIISDDQTPCLNPRSQSSVGPLSACVLTVASTPMAPTYYYNTNPMGYQTISHPIGAIHGYVQGPVLFQTSLYNQPSSSNSHTPLLRSLSEDGKMLLQQCPTDGLNQVENKETGLKIPSPESQHNTIIVTPLSEEARLGGAGVLYPEAGGSVVVGQNPWHLLLDPETGHCFYVDIPHLPQRKMLFDPETCQYVEVLLPQQTLPSAVLTPPCAIPFASLHIPPMYTPHCLPFVQSHPQVLPPPGP